MTKFHMKEEKVSTDENNVGTCRGADCKTQAQVCYTSAVLDTILWKHYFLAVACNQGQEYVFNVYEENLFTLQLTRMTLTKV